MKNENKGLQDAQKLRLWHKLALVATALGITLPLGTYFLVSSGFSYGLNTVFLTMLISLPLNVAIILLMTRGLSRQLQSLSNLTRELDQGAFDARAEVISQDELGRLAQSFNQTLDNTRNLMQSRDERDHIQRSIMKLLEEVSDVARGDLTREAVVTEDVTGAIADSFNFMITELRRIIGKVQDVSLQVTVRPPKLRGRHFPKP